MRRPSIEIDNRNRLRTRTGGARNDLDRNLPFYLGIAEMASAHALDGSVVLRATISPPELRPKSVPVQFIVATDVAKALAEQLPIAVRMAENEKQQGG